MRANQKRFVLLVALCGFSLTSCGQAPQPVSAQNQVLEGAGATFPAPLYEVWFAKYNAAQSEVLVEYDVVGSGEGVERFLAETVDFGASDDPLSDAEMAQSKRGAVLIPTTAASLTIAYNLPGVPSGLKLPRDVYADIFLGRITRWNDSRIQQANPDSSLPPLPIEVVVHSDGSGTTFVFTNHLAAISEAWKSGPGVGKKVQFPPRCTRAPGNEGVAGAIKRTPGAIGYVVYAVARQVGLQMASLQNQAGNFIPPSGTSGTSALANVPLDSQLRAFAADPAGKDSYPMISYSWLLLYREYPTAEKAESVKNLVRWCLTEGQTQSEQVGYVPLTESVVQAGLAKLDEVQGTRDQ